MNNDEIEAQINNIVNDFEIILKESTQIRLPGRLRIYLKERLEDFSSRLYAIHALRFAEESKKLKKVAKPKK